MKQIHISTISDYNNYVGISTLHPLITIVDLGMFARGSIVREDTIFRYDVYAIFMKETKSCRLRYGHSTYDYEEGTLLFIEPGQSIEVLSDEQTTPSGWALLFHPDLLHGTSLSRRIDRYRFFAYSSREALHTSERERQTITHCIDEIQHELEHPIDKHSKHILTSHVETMLNLCQRFYDRQFVTREASNHRVMQIFQTALSTALRGGDIRRRGVPSVADFAQELHLSPSYFGDLVKRETGRSAQEYIQLALLDRAKELLSTSTMSVSEIAYELGFAYPNHFSRLFKNKVGQTPSAYRLAE